jgi:NAD dependent epimerase/dehydratase
MSKKKILITGATGFIGSHLTELCVKKGFKVSAFDRYNPQYNLNCLNDSKYKKDINFIFGDIRDYDSVYKASKGMDIILHLAALIGIPYSYYSPMAYIKTNIEGTYNILEATKNLNIKQLIVTSTSETYGTAQKVPISENHRLIGQSPYSASKISADQLAISYWTSFQLPVKIIRPFNTYGPRQSNRAVIPTIINQALKNKNISLGNIKTTRDYTYVSDICEAYLEIIKTKNIFGQPINVGSNNEFKIEQIARKIIKKINPNLKIMIDKKRIRPEKSEVDRLKCDNRLIIKKTNWKPKIKFDEGLEKTIKWIRNNQKYFHNINDYRV